MTKRRLGTTTAWVATLTVLCGGLVACRGGGGPIVEGDAYPMQAPRSGTLDVHVLRDGATVTLTNTSGTVLGPGTMWLNGRYGREIDPIGLGASATYRLSSFKDEYGGAFRGGGFWAIEDPDTVVRVEVEQEGGLIGLIVTRGEPPE